MERTKLYDPELINITRKNTWKKIRKLQKISYFPTIGMGAIHLVILYFLSESEDFSGSYQGAIYLLIGALVFIFLANKTQGSKVLPRDSDSNNLNPWF